MNNFNENNVIDYKPKTFEINRSDSIYQEIESFKDHEFTNCIAYEMAIRNEDLKKILSILPNEDISINKKVEIKEKYFFNIKEYLEYKFPEQNNMFFKVQRGCDLITRNALNALSESKASAIANKKHSTLRFEDILAKNGSIKHLNNLTFNDLVETKIQQNTNFIAVQNISNITQINSNFIIRIQSRPNMEIPNNLKIETPKLNLALPLEELISIVTLYKKEYDKDNSLLDFFKDLKKDSKRNKNNKINNKIKIADRFFIYDAKKIGLSNVDICNSIEQYHYYKNNKKSNFDNKTLNNYLSFMQKCIDELKYKELISNI